MGEAPVLSSVPQEKPSLWDRITPHQVKHLVAGGVAGAVSRTSVSPFERLKILYQVIYWACYPCVLYVATCMLYVTLYVVCHCLYVVCHLVCYMSLPVCCMSLCMLYVVTRLYETRDIQDVMQHTSCILCVTSCVKCNFCVLYKLCVKAFDNTVLSMMSLVMYSE